MVHMHLLCIILRPLKREDSVIRGKWNEPANKSDDTSPSAGHPKCLPFCLLFVNNDHFVSVIIPLFTIEVRQEMFVKRLNP